MKKLLLIMIAPLCCLAETNICTVSKIERITSRLHWRTNVPINKAKRDMRTRPVVIESQHTDVAPNDFMHFDNAYFGVETNESCNIVAKYAESMTGPWTCFQFDESVVTQVWWDLNFEYEQVSVTNYNYVASNPVGPTVPVTNTLLCNNDDVIGQQEIVIGELPPSTIYVDGYIYAHDDKSITFSNRFTDKKMKIYWKEKLIDKHWKHVGNSTGYFEHNNPTGFYRVGTD